MLSRTAVPISEGGQEYSEHLAGVLAASFRSDALSRAYILDEDSAPNDTVISSERWLTFWISNIKKKIEAGGQIAEAGNWAAAALWFPPGVKRPPLGDRDELPATAVEYFDKFERVKEKHLGDRRYWYLNLIGRHPDRREPGVVRAIVEPYLQQAQDQGLPVFLEASNVHARDVYIHLGFRVVEEVHVGQGHVDENGNNVVGGKGVTLYGMIAEPRI